MEQDDQEISSAKNDSIALIVDPDFGARLRVVAAKSRHTWIVATAANVAVAEQIWATSGVSPPNMDGGVTTFRQYGPCAESCCAAILNTIDDHHSEYSQAPAYADLVVYGVQLTERLRSVLTELGFLTFAPTQHGFCAHKPAPVRN